MKISLRFIGNGIVEMTCNSSGTTVTEDITNLFGIVNPEFIEELEVMVEDLKEHNSRISHE